MKTVWSCLAASVVLMASVQASAQTLQDTLVKAYENNPTLSAQRASLRATDEGVPQALSYWRPTVNVTGSAGWSGKNYTYTGTSRTALVTNPRSATLSVTEDLYRGGRTPAGIAKAESDVQAGRAALAATEQTVLLNAATAYADVVQDQAVLELNINNERVLQRQLEATEDRFRVGELTRTDVSQAESRLSLAHADRTSAEGTLADSRANYRNIVGEEPGLLKPAQPLDDLPKSLSAAIADARTNNFTVREARYTVEAAQHTVDVTFGQLLPTVSVTGEALTQAESSTAYSQTNAASLTLSVSVPLYSSGSVTSEVRAAKQTVGQRQDQLSQAVRDAVQQATSAWQQLETARAQVTAYAAAVKAARIALEGVREEANVGSRTVLDVLNAEQELLNSQVSLVQAKHDMLVATFKVRQAVGNLTAKSLKLPVKLYDPTKYYNEVRNKWWGLDAPNGR